MGRPARLPFVELPRQSRLFRRFRVGKRSCDYLVEVKPSRRAGQIRARRIGRRTWVMWSLSVFLGSHAEVEHT